MLQIDAELRDRGMRTVMLLQIHDELLFEAPPDELDAACEMIRDRMEHCHPLRVPLKVDLGTGESWAAAH
jgi:DNA polymerase-1